MTISLKNYKTILSPDLIKKAEQNTVRECDEISNGHFQAYVDEKKETYDTFLVFDHKEEIMDHGCDCKSKLSFCLHCAALLLFIVQGKKVITKLNSTDRKRTASAFSTESTLEKVDFTPEEVQQLTLAAVHDIIKSKINLKIVDVIKIVDRWTLVHQPIIEDYCIQPADETAFLRLHTLLETCEREGQRVVTTSVRFVSYQQKILTSLLPHLDPIKDEEYWDQAVQYFIDRIIGPNNHVRLQYVSFLSKLILLSSIERKARLSAHLANKYQDVYLEQDFDKDNKYTIAMLSIVVDGGVFKEYGHLFTTISRYYNGYNTLLVKSLIADNDLDTAEYCALNLVDTDISNYYEDEYLELLREVYTLKNDKKSLSTIMKHKVPHTFDFQTYLSVRKNMNDKEKIGWYDYMFAKSRRLAYDYLAAADFSFQLLAREKKYSQMIDLIDHSATYDVIDKYLREMASKDSRRLFKNLISRSENKKKKLKKWEIEKLEPSFERILRVLEYTIPLKEIVAIFREYEDNYRYYDPSWFAIFLGKRFSNL